MTGRPLYVMFANEDTGYLPYTYTTKIVDKHILANYLSIFVETYDNEDVLQHYVDKYPKKTTANPGAVCWVRTKSLTSAITVINRSVRF